MAALSLSILGPTQAYLDRRPIVDFKSKKVQALLVYLGANRAAQRREHLMTLLWPGMPEKSARHNLRQTLYQLRRAFPEVASISSDPETETEDRVPLLLTDRSTVQLNPAADIEVDIRRFEALLASTNKHSHRELLHCRECGEKLQRAAALYRSDFLVDFYLEDSSQFEEWAQGHREVYRRQALGALETLTEICIREAKYKLAQDYAERQLAIDNLRENAYRQQMLILARRGQRPVALQQFAELSALLRKELDLAPAAETLALAEAIRDETLVDPAEPTTAGLGTAVAPEGEAPGSFGPVTLEDQEFLASQSIPVRHNLPAQTTPFIGREAELAELNALLQNLDTRLLTIVGPSGMGKTRLALAVAERLLEGTQFSDGIFFVDLVSLNEADQIPLAIGEALEIQLSGGEDAIRQELIAFLKDKAMLFLLDNFEHLLDGAQLVAEIAKNAPDVKALITSRQRLGLRGEQLYAIPGLDFSEEVTPEAIAASGAGQLFLSAARRLRPDFDLRPEDLPHLAHLCRLVGGMPLALELAAGWVELLSLAEIAAEIERGLDFLETEIQDVPDRQRSMQAVFETTWAQLEPTERALMEKLAVFRGGFTREAANQVAAGQGSPAAALRLLGRLVSKSLLQADPAQGRYQAHELLRQFARGKLEQSGELEAVRTAHADYFLAWLERQEADLKSGERRMNALDAIEVDFANIGAAWSWAVERGDLEAIADSIEGSYLYCDFRSRHAEGAALCSQAEAGIPSGPDRFSNPLWRKIAIYRLALSPWVMEDEAMTLEKEAERILKAAIKDHDPAETAAILMVLGNIQMHPNPEAALKNLQKSRALYRQLEDAYYDTQITGLISYAHAVMGDMEKRIQILQEQLELAQENGDRMLAADARGVLGHFEALYGRYETAVAVYREVLPVFQEFGDHDHVSEYLVRLAELAFLNGDFNRAREEAMEGYRLSRQYNCLFREIQALSVFSMVDSGEAAYGAAAARTREIPADLQGYFLFLRSRGLAYAMCGLGEFETAKRHLREIIEALTPLGLVGLQAQCLPAAALITAGEGDLERAAELLALALHHPASAAGWLEKFPLITPLRERVETELNPEAFAAAWARGQALDLGETLAAVLEEDLNN